jgi:hypothetical protein
MKLLVVTSEPISAQQLRDALPQDIDAERSEVMVVAPALQENPLKFWFSDADEAIAHAERVRQESVERLGAEGVGASGDTGESDPVAAIEDALQTFPADRIVVFTHGEDRQRYREDVDEEEIRNRFRLPIDRALLSA